MLNALTAGPARPDDLGAPVYQGGSITGIRDLGEKLGAKVDWDPNSGRVSVNGKNVPWATNLNGNTQGSVHDIVAAAGGRVVQGPGGVLQVYKTPSTSPATATAPTGGTSVTGSGSTTPAALTAQPTHTTTAPQTPGLMHTTAAQAAPAATAPTNPLATVAQQYGNGLPTTAAQSQANDERLKDPAYVKSEIARTQSVIQARQATGLPTTDQAAYLARLAGIDITNRMPALSATGAVATTPAPASAAPATTTTAAPAASAPPHQAAPASFSYQENPIDYNALQNRAALEAQMWANPQLQALKDAAELANQRYLNQAGYIKGDLAGNIADLRAGEVAREQRINEDMNRRGLYDSGVRFAGVAQQQTNAFDKEMKLTQAAQTKLTRLTDSLGITLQGLANKQAALALQQGNKAVLTLQQLADKAESAQFQNRKFAWQMYMQSSQLDQKSQQMANDLWLNIQRIKSADERAAATNDLKRWIASGQLAQKWAEIMGQDANGNPTRQAAKDAADAAYKQAQLLGYTRAPDGTLIRTLDGQKFDLAAAESISKQTGYVIGLDGKPLLDAGGDPVRTLDGAKFDWDKQKFQISEGWKESYEGALLQLKQSQAITDAEYKQAQLDIQKGQLNVQMSKLIGKVLDSSSGIPMRDSSGNEIPVDSGSTGNPNSASNAAWKGVMGDLGGLIDPVKTSGMSHEQILATAQAIVQRWLPQLGPQEQASLKQWLQANGLM